jgi:hypothetical protein
MLYAECPSVELSRVVVLGSRPVGGDTVNKLIKSQTLLLKKIHLDGRGLLQVKSPGPGGRLRLE